MKIEFSFLTVVGFLELINNMLTSGMVPALYNYEEKEQIIGQVCHSILYVLRLLLLFGSKDPEG